ncbi:MAG: DUF4157 domain-containing protein, partial [Chloroflexi bacterium]
MARRTPHKVTRGDKSSEESRRIVQEEAGPAQTPMPRDVLALQKQAGNHAVNQLLQPDESKDEPPRISQPGDAQERQADQAAAAALAGSTSEKPAQEQLRPAQEKPNKKEGSEEGKPLPDTDRRFFEAAYNQDLGSVRLHTGRQAAGLADALDAQAVTSGSDIFLDREGERLNAPGGRQVLAHELAHVALHAGAPGTAQGATVFRKTRGETMVDKADQWISTNDQLKDKVDILKVALRGAKKGKSVAYKRRDRLVRA